MSRKAVVYIGEFDLRNENVQAHLVKNNGKLLKQLAVMSNGWNGTFNGYALPADDYWFHLNFENGKIIKGHFSLKR